MSDQRQPPPDERRSSERVAATFAVREATGPQTRDVHLCQAEDIALGGITIKHAKGQSHDPQAEVVLRFALPGSREEIDARGVIVSDARAGRFRRTGVRFIAIRPEHQQLIAAFCRRR
jgi:c-di-GMP-binding flagellar brake protein YcgR